MKHILQTLFLTDVVNNIDKKYKDIVNVKDNFFSYANIYDAPLYYKLFTYKKDADYKLYDKLLNSKHYEVIECLIKIICEENYQANHLLLLYSYISNIILNTYLDDYVNNNTKNIPLASKKMKMRKYSKTIKYIEAQYYKELYYKPIKTYKINYKKIEITDDCFDIINKICSKIYYFSYGIDIFKIGHKKFIKHQKNKHSIFRPIYKAISNFLDTFTRSKKYSAASIYNTYTPLKKDYLNKQNKLWISNKTDCYKSFFDVYSDALKEACKLITLVSEEIFYKVKKTAEIKAFLNKLSK